MLYLLYNFIVILNTDLKLQIEKKNEQNVFIFMLKANLFNQSLDKLEFVFGLYIPFAFIVVLHAYLIWR